jgi:hypothetical protein
VPRYIKFHTDWGREGVDRHSEVVL